MCVGGYGGNFSGRGGRVRVRVCVHVRVRVLVCVWGGRGSDPAEVI